jgi:hypothetical protein
MEDLHRCDFIHADLKASNILVTPVIISPGEEKFDGSQGASESIYFYVNIGDFEASNGVVGTGFWRAPEVLLAVRDNVKPILSPAADVYSYGMLCYELLTGHIPFEKCGLSNYNLVLSGQRPDLPPNVNLKMKKLLRLCWHKEPQKRPGWKSIIETLKEELILHPLGSQQPKSSAQPRVGMVRETIKVAAATSETVNVVVTSWEEVVALGLGTEAFASWKVKIVPEILPFIKAILACRKALRQETLILWKNIMEDEIMSVDGILTDDNTIIRHVVLCALDNAWDVVGYAWTNRVVKGFDRSLLQDRRWEEDNGLWYKKRRDAFVGKGLGSELQDRWRAPDIFEEDNGIWYKNSHSLLGRKHWLKKILSTSKEWELFQTVVNTWQSENEGSFRRWKKNLQEASFAWDKICVAFHAWHLKGPITNAAWNSVRYSEYRENVNFKEF